MPKKPTVPKRPVRKKPTPQSTTVRRPSAPRVLPLPKRVWNKPATWFKRLPVPLRKPLPKARLLFHSSLAVLWGRRKLFGGIVLIYGILNLAFVRGFAGSSNLTSLKATLDSVVHGVAGQLTSSLTTFVYLLGTSGSSNSATSGVYQTIALTVCSLAFIWALRQTQAKHDFRIRDSFYQGMYPLVPFLLVLLIIGLQLLPLVLGGSLYGAVVSNGIAVNVWEKLLFGAIFLALGLWSLRMITSSIFALYIVTLPDMAPLKAIRSAKQLVYGRRLLIWRKLIYLPIILLLIAVAVELPLILLLTPVAVWVFFAISMAALGVVHAYLYGLYRELL
jgi:hypothetical protein